MTSETTIVTPVEIMSAKVGMLVMSYILLDSYAKLEDTTAAREQRKEIAALTAEMDCEELSEAIYHYKKATSKLDSEMLSCAS